MWLKNILVASWRSCEGRTGIGLSVVPGIDPSWIPRLHCIFITIQKGAQLTYFCELYVTCPRSPCGSPAIVWYQDISNPCYQQSLWVSAISEIFNSTSGLIAVYHVVGNDFQELFQSKLSTVVRNVYQELGESSRSLSLECTHKLK